MLIAHLKRVLKLDRLRLRGPARLQSEAEVDAIVTGWTKERTKQA